MSENFWKKQMKWAKCVSYDYMLHDLEFRTGALKEAKKIMRVVNKNVNLIAERLVGRNYRFVDPNRIITPPETDIEYHVINLAKRGIYLPISFQAWLEEVGSVNFMGSDPNWDFPGYAFDNSDNGQKILSTDPLVVETNIKYILHQHDNWIDQYYEHDNWMNQGNEDSCDEIEPFRISIAPDDLHKANISGGAPYEIMGNTPCVESLVYNERHTLTFVAYLRYALLWGGFPGLDISENQEIEFIKLMKKDLIEF